MSDLPEELLRYLADSTVSVVSWSGDTLVLGVSKDIGPEHGLLELGGISHVNLPRTLEIESIEVGTSKDLPAQFFEIYRPTEDRLDAVERVFLFYGSCGEKFFVIAEGVKYGVASKAERR